MKIFKTVIFATCIFFCLPLSISSCGIIDEKEIESRIENIDIDRVIDKGFELVDKLSSSEDSIPEYPELEIPVSKKKNKGEIVKHLGYTTNYDTTLLIPIWVAYELTDDEVVGTEERSNKFIPDPDLTGWCATTQDYTNSGYDRGHMAPAGDMKWDKQAMKESFYMSNICPQNHNLNAGDWKELEEQVRDWTIKNQKIYVVCGPIVGKDYKTIGENRVAVPESFFKVVLMYKDGSWRALGFLFKNESGQRKLEEYTRSVDEIEKITKLDFFSALPDEIENEIEKNKSFSDFEN